MADFERSRGRRDSRPPRRERRDFEDMPRERRDSGRGFNRYSRERREVEMTDVVCSSCGKECQVPFKPRSNKPLFCKECFDKQEKGSSKGSSGRDLEKINEKLDKIMKALKIE